MNEPETETSIKQKKVEKSVEELFTFCDYAIEALGKSAVLTLQRELHVEYLKSGLRLHPSTTQYLDANRSWLLYWICHALELLDEPLGQEFIEDAIQFVGKCQNKDGGFGGGPYHMSHLAPTYSFISSLAIFNCKEAYDIIDRENLYTWLCSLKNDDGSFRVSETGESDLRAMYCAIVAAKLTGILDERLTKGCVEYIKRCQSFDGGLGGEPGNEAHGGYSFCGIATLAILNAEDSIDFPAFIHWLTMRQTPLEGGFQGRTNKLVDGCYSYWQGALFPLVDRLYLNKDLYKDNNDKKDYKLKTENWLFDQLALQKYIIVCCQDKRGGLRDKPNVNRDFYHTCYCLSGLSIAQNNPHYNKENPYTILGDEMNLLKPTDPVYNVAPEKIVNIIKYFEDKPIKKDNK